MCRRTSQNRKKTRANEGDSIKLKMLKMLGQSGLDLLTCVAAEIEGGLSSMEITSVVVFSVSNAPRLAQSFHVLDMML